MLNTASPSRFVRYNYGSHCVGSGIRLGGWEVDGIAYGRDNEVRRPLTLHTKNASRVNHVSVAALTVMYRSFAQGLATHYSK